jgi:hypothetical protein
MLDFRESSRALKSEKPKINFRAAFRASVIARSSCKTARTLDIELKAKNALGATFSYSFLLANVTGTSGSDVAKRSQ